MNRGAVGVRVFHHGFWPPGYFTPEYWPGGQWNAGGSLRLHLTGAASDGGAQTDPDLALGNYRSSTLASRVAATMPSGIANLRIDQISGACASDPAVAAAAPGSARGFGVEAVGVIVASAGRLVSFAAANGSRGPAVELFNGDTARIADGSDASKFVEVTRTGAARLAGMSRVEIERQLGNIFAMGEALDAQTTAGGSRYRCVAIYAELPLGAVKIRLAALGTAATTSAAQLSGAGAGTITGAALCFADWPWTGYAQVRTSGGALRETVYYSSRSDESLTVPAGGRGLLGTSAAAGAANDVATPVAGIRLALETPVADAVQTIANESTAPTGRTWNAGITSAGGLDAGNIPAGSWVGLWIHRQVPAGATGCPWHFNAFTIEYAVGVIDYVESCTGVWRAAVDALERYELHVGVDELPDLDAAADETFSSLPETPAYDASADGTYYVAVNRRNKYGVVSRRQVTATIRVESSDETELPPLDPEVDDFFAGAGGVVHLKALYQSGIDGDNAADTWLIFLATGGSAPNPAIDTPIEVATAPVFGAARLEYTSGAYANGTVVKAIVMVERSSDGLRSVAQTVLGPVTASTATPSAPTGLARHRGVLEI